MEDATFKKDAFKVVIIGGGITGLSAAWEITQSLGPAVQMTVLEKESHWGGKIQTLRFQAGSARFIFEAGPESFITRKPEVWDIAQELGLGESLMDPGSETRGIYVLDQGRPLLIPLSPVAFIRSSLMSARGKLRMLAEPFIPSRKDDGDESLAEFATRRLGHEAMEKFIGPVLAGIYNTNPERQSILTTSPIMREMEKEYGGLFKAVIGRARAARKSRKLTPPRPRFVTFINGADQLVDALVLALAGADLRLDTAVLQVTPYDNGYAVYLASGEVLEADAVILATLANVTSQLIMECAPAAAMLLSKIRHENIGTLALAYTAADVPPGKMTGMMIPRRENRSIDAVQWTSVKMPGRASPGYTLLRIFFGGGHPGTVNMDDAVLLSQVRSELKDLLGIEAEPLAYRVVRMPSGFPQADIGHLKLVDQIEAALPAGLYVAGSSYRGIGVPDCIRQGRDAAIKAAAYLQTVGRATNTGAVEKTQ